MTVSSQLTTLSTHEGSPTYTSIGSGGGATANNDVFIEAIQSGGRRADNATDKGFMVDISSTDLSALGVHMRQWIYCFHWPSVTELNARMQSGTNVYDNHNFPLADLPLISGWLPMWLDISRIPDSIGSTSGLDESALVNPGFYLTIGNVGGAGSNTILDFSSYGTSALRWTGAGPAGTFADFASFDATNSIGAFISLFDQSFMLMTCQIGGGGVEADFTDTGFAVTVPDQPLVAQDGVNLLLDIDHASSVIDLSDGAFGAGDPVGSASRPSIYVPDDLGTVTMDGLQLPGLRRLRLNGKCTLTNSVMLLCGQVDPTNGDYGGGMDLPGTDEYIDTTTSLDVTSASGDFEIIMLVEADDWTPAGTEALASHYAGAANTTSFRLQLNGSTQLVLIVGDGTTTTTLTSTAITGPQTDGDPLWIRVTYDQSAGQADFFFSRDPQDTPSGDVSWTASGTPSGTSRTMPSQSRPILLGAENSGTPAAFFDGRIYYFEFWNDGFRATGASLGDLVLRADWRIGPDFTGSPSIRADDFNTSLDWEEQGSAPIYTTAEHNLSTACDLDGTAFKSSRSEAAIYWNVNTDPDGELDNTLWVSDGTGHAYEIGPNAPSTITLRDNTTSGYAASDGSTGNETFHNNSRKSVTLNWIGGTGNISIRNGTGASTALVISPVTATFRCFEGSTDTDIQNVRVLVLAGAVGDMNSDAPITSITRSGQTATVTTTAAHGLSTNDVVRLLDSTEEATEVQYSGVFTITVTGANTWTMTVQGSPDTPSSGSWTFSDVIINNELTDVSGEVSDTRSYSADQSIVGIAIKGGTAPTFKAQPITGTISSSAATNVPVPMTSDD